MAPCAVRAAGGCRRRFRDRGHHGQLQRLAAARHALLDRVGWDVEARGLFGAPPITVIVGAEAHVSVLKALSLLGLGRERVVRVPVDGQGRMRPEAIPRCPRRRPSVFRPAM